MKKIIFQPTWGSSLKDNIEIAFCLLNNFEEVQFKYNNTKIKVGQKSVREDIIKYWELSQKYTW